mgnify:CR=1 FL=1
MRVGCVRSATALRRPASSSERPPLPAGRPAPAHRAGHAPGPCGTRCRPHAACDACSNFRLISGRMLRDRGLAARRGRAAVVLPAGAHSVATSVSSGRSGAAQGRGWKLLSFWFLAALGHYSTEARRDFCICCVAPHYACSHRKTETRLRRIPLERLEKRVILTP